MSIWWTPFLLQSAAIAVDEFYFHPRRELPAWERIGHPLDTLSLCACLSWALFVPYSISNLAWYAGFAIFSCLLVTKDEFVHAKLCTSGEHWLHALLFILHPVVLVTVGWLWEHSEIDPGYSAALATMTAASSGFLVYQIVYWNFVKTKLSTPEVNNAVYEALGDRWYTADADPIALLRAESRVKNPWVIEQIRKGLGTESSVSVLDIGCGGGFLANALALSGHRVTGLDLSPGTLEVAKHYDVTKAVEYVEGDASSLPFENARFDVVCCMDFLEHVENPAQVIEEASRVLAPGGLFVFHTFNRNIASWLFAVKGIEWFVRNAPKNIHLYRLFLRPNELAAMCKLSGLEVEKVIGVRPVLLTRAFFKLLTTRQVDPRFEFKLTRSLRVGYLGVARSPLKNANRPQAP